MTESDRPTFDPFDPSAHDQHDQHDQHGQQDQQADPTVPPAGQQWPSDPLPPLEHDLQVLAWLQGSPELDGEVKGYVCDALLDWALESGRGWPDMALPDAGPQCDHWQALVQIYERFNQRIAEASSVAAKLELGRTGRLLGRAVWAARDPEAVRDSIDRELLMAMPWLAGPPAPYVLPDGTSL